MPKIKPPSDDTPDFDWARGVMREPDMSKMPAMKPMASHKPAAPKQVISRPLKGRR